MTLLLQAYENQKNPHAPFAQALKSIPSLSLSLSLSLSHEKSLKCFKLICINTYLHTYCVKARCVYICEAPTKNHPEKGI